MTGFQNRMSGAEERETLLAHELELRGWTVWRWEPIPDEAREHLLLRHMKLPLRWWPDLFAVNGTLAALVDAKGILAPNGAIEADAAWTYESIGRLCPVLVFWQTKQGGWVGTNASALREFTKHEPLKGTRAGSGTPWYKIPADWLSPLDNVLYQLKELEAVQRRPVDAGQTIR